jgi:hypothetical protein
MVLEDVVMAEPGDAPKVQTRAEGVVVHHARILLHEPVSGKENRKDGHVHAASARPVDILQIFEYNRLVRNIAHQSSSWGSLIAAG